MKKTIVRGLIFVALSFYSLNGFSQNSLPLEKPSSKVTFNDNQWSAISSNNEKIKKTLPLNDIKEKKLNDVFAGETISSRTLRDVQEDIFNDLFSFLLTIIPGIIVLMLGIHVVRAITNNDK